MRGAHDSHTDELFYIDNAQDERFLRPVTRIKELIVSYLQLLKEKNKKYEIIPNYEA